jgi:micrococcal nuclease
MRLRPSLGHIALLSIIAIIALACTTDAQVDEPTASLTVTPTPYVRPGLQAARVTRVVDGDTIRVEIDGTEYRLRYIGIDTPETVDPRRPVQCFGKEASERNRQLVTGQTVGLEKDVSETDEFDRLLRYVWVGDTMVNATLVQEGYALASTYPPDVRHSERFAALQAEAREASRGLWGAACSGPPAAP